MYHLDEYSYCSDLTEFMFVTGSLRVLIRWWKCWPLKLSTCSKEEPCEWFRYTAELFEHLETYKSVMRTNSFEKINDFGPESRVAECRPPLISTVANQVLFRR